MFLYIERITTIYRPLPPIHTHVYYSHTNQACFRHTALQSWICYPAPHCRPLVTLHTPRRTTLPAPLHATLHTPLRTAQHIQLQRTPPPHTPHSPAHRLPGVPVQVRWCLDRSRHGWSPRTCPASAVWRKWRAVYIHLAITVVLLSVCMSF